MQKLRFLSALSVLSLLAVACGGGSSSEGGQDDPIVDPDPKPEAPAITRSIQSANGCALDSDCETGSFCFQGQCVVQCSNELKLNCESGYYCQESRGRCVTKGYLEEVASVQKKIDEAGDTMSASEIAALRANLDVKAKSATNVRGSVIGNTNAEGKKVEKVTFSQRVPGAALIDASSTHQDVTFDTTESVGDVHYVVKLKGSDIPVLKTAKGEKNSDGTYTYKFEVDSNKLSTRSFKKKLRDRSDIGVDCENVEFISGVGNSEITLCDAPASSGVYEGYASPEKVLSGIDLPVRMALKTTPAKLSKFTDIESLELSLPVNTGDIFSPENVELDGSNKPVETWATVKMSKASAAECSSKKNCFVGVYSTNSYAPYNSGLFDATSKVNRNIRVEIYDYDMASQTFTGRLVDTLTGLYREFNSDGQKSFNDTSMAATFSITLKSAITEKLSMHEHTPANAKEGIRSIDEAPALICDDKAIAELYKQLVIPAEYQGGCASITEEEKKAECNAYAKCDNIKSLKTLNEMDPADAWFCTDKAVNSMLADDARLSKVLEKVLTSDAEGKTDLVIETSCGEIQNFADFQDKCGDSNCSLCKERPEIACAADLIAHRYLGSAEATTEEKSGMMRDWLDVIRESYLAQEYSSWNQDTNIRKSWLTGAVYAGTFAASIMSNFNDNLLKDYREKVLDVHHSIMGKQFSQTVLEMLSQSFLSDNENIELRSARNAVLSELSQTWESMSESLGLSARRNDVLLQDDAKRINMAAILKPYLFDLYFAGVVESAINLKADQGSLNAAYGANLSSILAKLESLDQGFEDLVFMRDGEVFTDTRLETDSNKTALGTLKETAEKSIQKAIQKREAVFKAIDDKAKETLSIKDNYLTALEAMRSEIVDICGYPKDCTGEAQDTCKLFTTEFFCGFSLNSTDTTKAVIDPETTVNFEKSSISQVTDYYDCIKTQTAAGKTQTNAIELCQGGNLALPEYEVSYANAANISQAGLAILAYREADEDYQSALAEYDVLAQKVANNYALLNSYAKNIESWYSERTKQIESITANITKINEYADKIDEIQNKISAKELEATQNEYEEQSKNLDKWKELAGANLGLQETFSTIISGTNIANIWVSRAADDMDAEAQQSALNGILANTAILGGASTASNAAKANLVSVAASTAATGYGIASATLETAAEGASLAAEIAQNAFDFSIEKLDRQTDLNIAEIQKKLAEEIDEIKDEATQLTDTQLLNAIEELERENDKLTLEMQNLDSYKRDLQELDTMRNEFKNVALDLIPLAHTVKVKEIAKQRALLQYKTLVQRAMLVQSQYDSKMARYQTVNNKLNSASAFFENASDLESVETFIEYARNDLSDYLTAIEYMTVRPFVELRRSIYTARGTNDLEILLEQLNDLTNNCGSGAESTNKVTISLRNRLGIPENAEFNELSPEDRFHTMLAMGSLPVSAQTRYTVTGSIADELKAGSFYSGSFNLSSSFANISTSCNAKIDEIQIRFVSKEGKTIRTSTDATPTVSLFYGGQTQLLSCHAKIEAITASIGPRTTYGKYSTFTVAPFADGFNAGIYEVPANTNYQLNDKTEFTDVTVYRGLKNYPLMATYTLVFDPSKGENSKINWDNVADIEVQFKYTTGTLGQSSDKCKYDIQ